MTLGEPALVEFIREKIRRDGPVSFRWFMQQALYHPQHGYYSSGRAAIGRGGDYFTNVSVGPIFGQLLAAQFAEIWERSGRPRAFSIVEQGAHDGNFAGDVLNFLRAERRDFFDALDYKIIEPFPIWRERQGEKLPRFVGKISWHESLDDLEKFSGIHFSNELLDAMPVHLVRGDQELLVDFAGDEFVFVEQKLADSLQQFLPAAEINLDALAWIEMLAPKLKRGLILICDYGRADGQPTTPGTLAAIKNHRRLESPLVEIGHADITAHVDWSSLLTRAENHGLRFAGFADQHHFLAGILSAHFANQSLGRGLQTLLHPEMLGRNFQFLALEKNSAAATTDTPLSGFRFGRKRDALD